MCSALAFQLRTSGARGRSLRYDPKYTSGVYFANACITMTITTITITITIAITITITIAIITITITISITE